MRIAHVVGSGLLPALLVVAVGAGCGGGHPASGPVQPDSSGRLVATISGDGVLPGEQRLPDGAPALTTTTTQPPIARTSSPVGPMPVPVTRPPLQLGPVATTSTAPAPTTPAPAPTTTTTVARSPETAPTTAPGTGSDGGASQTGRSAPTTTTTAGVLGRMAMPRS